MAVKGDIDHLVEDGVIFKGDSHVTPCDVLLLATGYKISFPFFSESIVPIIENRIRLYKHQFIHNFPHSHTLAFIGLVQPLGAVVPIAEV